MKYVYPVLVPEEAEAAKVTLRAVLGKRLLVDHDADKVRGVLEALESAPTREGSKVERDPAAKQLGKFARDSKTSRAAALRNYPRAGSQRDRVIKLLIREEGGLTREEVGQRLNLPPNVATPRCLEAIEGGWVTHATDSTGSEMTRKTGSGSDAEVLIASERARMYYRQHPDLG